MRTDLERIGWRMVVRNLQNWHPTQLAFILAQSAERTKVHKKKNQISLEQRDSLGVGCVWGVSSENVPFQISCQTN